MAAYGSDLTYIHDTGHGDLARAAAQTVIAALHRAGRDHGRVVDLGCGSGIFARALLDAGFDVTGFDLSEAMIATARLRAPHADLRIGSFLDADIPACVAVTAVGECFSYLFDEKPPAPAPASTGCSSAFTAPSSRAASSSSTWRRRAACAARARNGTGARVRIGRCWSRPTRTRRRVA